MERATVPRFDMGLYPMLAYSCGTLYPVPCVPFTIQVSSLIPERGAGDPICGVKVASGDRGNLSALTRQLTSQAIERGSDFGLTSAGPWHLPRALLFLWNLPRMAVMGAGRASAWWRVGQARCPER